MTHERTQKHRDLVDKRELLDEAGIRNALAGLARDILESHTDPRSLVLVGIRTLGVPLAERLRALIAERVGFSVPLGVMDITLYRDDVYKDDARPVVGTTELPCSLEGRVVILVDDVLFTGRTTRAALAELMDYGRPEMVKLAVLVDRGHRELPIQPDYVGLSVKTARDELVTVTLSEVDGTDRVVLRERVSP